VVEIATAPWLEILSLLPTLRPSWTKMSASMNLFICVWPKMNF